MGEHLKSSDGLVLNVHKKPRTFAQLNYMYGQFKSVVDMLDVKSLNEIGGGSLSDVDKLMNIIW